MKQKQQSGRSLESLSFFPYIAWTVIILFAVFVYNLTTNLQAAADKLNERSTFVEVRAQTPVDQIEDFAN